MPACTVWIPSACSAAPPAPFIAAPSAARSSSTMTPASAALPAPKLAPITTSNWSKSASPMAPSTWTPRLTCPSRKLPSAICAWINSAARLAPAPARTMPWSALISITSLPSLSGSTANSCPPAAQALRPAPVDRLGRSGLVAGSERRLARFAPDRPAPGRFMVGFCALRSRPVFDRLQRAQKASLPASPQGFGLDAPPYLRRLVRHRVVSPAYPSPGPARAPLPRPARSPRVLAGGSLPRRQPQRHHRPGPLPRSAFAPYPSRRRSLVRAPPGVAPPTSRPRRTTHDRFGRSNPILYPRRFLPHPAQALLRPPPGFSLAFAGLRLPPAGEAGGSGSPGPLFQ